MAEGEGCPLCELGEVSTSSLFYIAKLSASYLYLNKNQIYRGACALVCNIRHVTRPSQLSEDEWHAFSSDIRRVEQAISSAIQPDHINIEMLGNTVPHLHAHFFPRTASDPRWGHPIWFTSRSEMPRKRLESHEYAEIAAQILKVMNNP